MKNTCHWLLLLWWKKYVDVPLHSLEVARGDWFHLSWYKWRWIFILIVKSWTKCFSSSNPLCHPSLPPTLVFFLACLFFLLFPHCIFGIDTCISLWSMAYLLTLSHYDNNTTFHYFSAPSSQFYISLCLKLLGGFKEQVFLFFPLFLLQHTLFEWFYPILNGNKNVMLY